MVVMRENPQGDINKSRGLRNNNPGNIRHSSTRWQGEISIGENTQGLDSDFKTFVSMAYGYRAMFKLLFNYSNMHELRTLRAMILRWAPPTENNSEDYINAVARWSGVSAEQVIDVRNEQVMVAVVAAMSRMENGVKAVDSDVLAGWKLFEKEL